MSSLFNTGIRPLVDSYLLAEAAKVRDYGKYWSASSAGYCMRKNIFERLKVPHIETEGDARKQRVFSSGKTFHEWIQRITKNAGACIAQEMELEDQDLLIRGHIDDLVLVDGRIILYDYKTQNSRAFTYQKGKAMSYFHKMQLGTYMYMLRKLMAESVKPAELDDLPELTEARILKISKDDLRMEENQLMWSAELEAEVFNYWNTLNAHWNNKNIPPCTCADQEGGFLAKPQYNPYFYEGEPCSMAWYSKHKKEQAA